ncbi:MAG: polyphosphate kinase 1 [Planctomycetes bacterium]|nr:polyphosphate kinase 1 [Planctomycetota bacterium]
MSSTTSGYVNRELSWLEFNQRVLDEARDDELPLLERLKFLAITASNLDEFFMVRVGGLQQLTRQDPSKRDAAGMTAAEQLAAISRRTHLMTSDQYACFLEDLEPALAGESLRRVRPAQLSERQRKFVEQVFDDQIFTVLTPMAVTGAEDFPLVVNQSLNACVRLEPAAGFSEPRFAIIPFGRTVSRFLTLPTEGGYEYILLEDLVCSHAERFFPGEPAAECVAFRITRNADMSLREDQASDLLTGMEELLDARKESDCVRLEVGAEASATLLAFLKGALGVADEDVYAPPGPLDLAAFMRLTDVEGFDRLKYKPWPPQPSPDLDPRESIFDVLVRKSVLLCHPFDSFEPVQRLVEEAADDPDVLAIKQTLYRTSRNSPVVAALGRAAENGKHVTAIVELKARFDEARNIEWARNLEQAGVQVIYGVRGLKTHAKLCIVIRREPHGIQRYLHFGTGNYNEQTARLYSDISYLTSDANLGADATSFFNAVTGYSQPQHFRKISAAPIGLRDTLLELIQSEIERKRHGQEARILAKLNALADPPIIDALYEASQAGVEVRLNVRGICCLRPHVPELSENITVVSIIDRFLEHSRIMHFHHGGRGLYFISSADWMPRNLDRRVELLVPIDDAAGRRRLGEILHACLGDRVKGRRLRPDGGYDPPPLKSGGRIASSQEQLYLRACELVHEAEQSQRTVFIPHRATGSGP